MGCWANRWTLTGRGEGSCTALNVNFGWNAPACPGCKGCSPSTQPSPANVQAAAGAGAEAGGTAAGAGTATRKEGRSQWWYAAQCSRAGTSNQERCWHHHHLYHWASGEMCGSLCWHCLGHAVPHKCGPYLGTFLYRTTSTCGCLSLLRSHVPLVCPPGVPLACQVSHSPGVAKLRTRCKVQNTRSGMGCPMPTPAGVLNESLRRSQACTAVYQQNMWQSFTRPSSFLSSWHPPHGVLVWRRCFTPAALQLGEPTWPRSAGTVRASFMGM